MDGFVKFSEVDEIQLIKKKHKVPCDLVQLNSYTDTYLLYKALWNEDTIDLYEEFKVLYLDENNYVLGMYTAGSGGRRGTIVDERLLFAAAIKLDVNKIVLGHNHPSGLLIPSVEDKKLTRKLIEVGKILYINIIDHFIVTSGSGYYSFSENKLLSELYEPETAIYKI